MHHKNEVTKIIQEITAGQGLEIDLEIGLIHWLMDDYVEQQNSNPGIKKSSDGICTVNIALPKCDCGNLMNVSTFKCTCGIITLNT